MIYFDGYTFKKDLQYNLYILKKHLIKNYGEEAAEQLLTKYSKNLFGANSLAYVLGEIDLEFFIMYYLQDTFVPKDTNSARNLAKVHYEIFEELEKIFIKDLYDKEEFILCRGLGKSTVINKAISCYLHCYRKSIYSIVIGNKEGDAVQFVSDTRKMLESPIIAETFGNLIDTRSRTVNKQELELTNDTKIQAFSWGSSVRGTTYGSTKGISRPTLVILDDIISEEDILSDNAKEKVLNKYYKEISEVGDAAVYRNGQKVKQGTKILVIGTPLAADCFINTIRKDSTFKVFKRGVCNFDIDNYFETNPHWIEYKNILFSDEYEDKEAKDHVLRCYYDKHFEDMQFETIWEKYTCDEIAQKYFTKRTTFMQELMCATEKIGEKWFRSVRNIERALIEEASFYKTMLCIDPASTTGKNSDFTAMCVGSMARNGFKYVRRGILAKYTFNQLCEKVIDLLECYSDISHIYIEKNTYQGADLIRIKELIQSNTALKNRRIEFINEMQSKNKDNKISAIVDDVNSGMVLFAKEDQAFINQVVDFTGQNYSLHDDAPDITAEFIKRIEDIEVTRKISVKNKLNMGF